MQRKDNKKEKIVSKNWSKHSIGIVVAKFNSDITSKLLEGAIGLLKQHGFKDSQLDIVWVPGSFELPIMCQHLARTKKYSGLIALGCVIKGDTDHYYYVAGEASRGIMQVMLEESIPIGFGVITTNNLKQAQDRCGKENNKGAEAAEPLLQMMEKLSKKK
jgi:6,7-dimethyl-8-ribityllumazine synthase